MLQKLEWILVGVVLALAGGVWFVAPHDPVLAIKIGVVAFVLVVILNIITHQIEKNQ